MDALVCPTSFKGVLSARQAAAALARGVEAAGHRPRIQPLADGGEGTLDAVLGAGVRHRARVDGPYGEAIDAEWGLLPDGTALVEMAQASGLACVGVKVRDLPRASTFGTGQLIAAALAAKPRRLVVGLGGSATNDGGAGALRALGARFLDASGVELRDAAGLERLEQIEPPPFPQELEVIAASDVDNPLSGPEGATHVFGRQKGATVETTALLERALSRYGRILRSTCGWEVGTAPGAGAAGGLGAALLAFLGARFRPGVDVVMEAVGFDAAVREADALLTGEGRLDSQSLHGKAIAGVIRHAQGKPVLAVCGRVALEEPKWREWGIAGAISASPERPPETAELAQSLLERAARILLERTLPFAPPGRR
jgi:glycerate kinase